MIVAVVVTKQYLESRIPFSQFSSALLPHWFGFVASSAKNIPINQMIFSLSSRLVKRGWRGGGGDGSEIEKGGDIWRRKNTIGPRLEENRGFLGDFLEIPNWFLVGR